MTTSLRQRVLAYIAQHNVMTLATRSEDDHWAAAVFYVNQKFSFYFLSASRTRHAGHLRLNDRAAATIQEDYDRWEAIQGVQMEGTVRLLSTPEREMAMRFYREKFTFLEDASTGIKEAFRMANWYCLTPTRLYFVDNSRGFGHRDEVPL